MFYLPLRCKCCYLGSLYLLLIHSSITFILLPSFLVHPLAAARPGSIPFIFLYYYPYDLKAIIWLKYMASMYSDDLINIIHKDRKIQAHKLLIWWYWCVVPVDEIDKLPIWNE